MNPRRYALVGGIVMLAMGVLALVPAFSPYSYELIPLNFEVSYGLFLGMFPMNILNKIVLILFGIYGIRASQMENRSLPMSIAWSRTVFFVTGLATILGLIPATSTLFGLWPLYGGAVLYHGIFAILGAFYGYTLTSKAAQNEEVKKDEPKFPRRAA